jgi:hypothetical protein
MVVPLTRDVGLLNRCMSPTKHWPLADFQQQSMFVYSLVGNFWLIRMDKQALTILLSLSCPETYLSGGETAFWSQDTRGHCRMVFCRELMPRTVERFEKLSQGVFYAGTDLLQGTIGLRQSRRCHWRSHVDCSVL